MTSHDDGARDETSAEALAAYFRLVAADRQAAGGETPSDVTAVEFAARIEQAESCVELLARVWPDAAPRVAPVEADARACPADGRQTEPIRIGKFELLHDLGRGAYGVVLLARDGTLGRNVALKLPRPEVLVNRELRERFLREARAASQLAHPNLVNVFEAGESGPICYIALEYCPGPTLAEWLRERNDPVPPVLAAGVVLTLAGAVQCAHERGILHRDLKPSNVILDSRATDGGELPFVPKVADFGTAKLSGHDADATRTGALLGTTQYMSPEQADSRLAEVGPQTDVYSLGVMLYELLTLQPPFRGETPLDTLRCVATEEPVPPRRLRGAVPADLEAVCLKCLEKDPRRRYGSAGALAEDLARFLAGAPTLARPLGAAARAWKWARRKPAAAALLAVSCLALAVLVAGGAWHTATLQSALDVAEARRLEAQDHAAVAQARQREMREYLYATDMKLADDAWKRSHVEQTVELLRRYENDSAADDLRTFPWYRLWSLCNSHSLELSGHDGDVYCVVSSPDGKLLATAGRDGTVRLWDADTGRELSVLRAHAGELSNVCFSPDGTVLATCGDDDVVRLWDTSSGSDMAALRGHTADVFVVAFSPDGKLLASGAKDRTVKIWDIATRRERSTLAGHSGGIESLAFSSDGALLATGSGDRHVKLWSVLEAREVATLDGHEGIVLAVAFSPDGRTLASGSEDYTVKLWDVESHRETRTLGPHAEVLQSVAFSPDGRTLAAAVKDGTAQLWNIQTGESAGVLRGHIGRVWYVAYAPDGRSLATASGDGTVRIWSVLAAQDGQRLTIAPLQLRALDFSPDSGQLLAAFWSDHPDRSAVQLWNLGRNTHELSWQISGGDVVDAVFAPQARHIAVGNRSLAPSENAERPGVSLLDVVTGRLESTVSRGTFGQGKASTLSAMDCSPDGRRIAVARDDGILELWNLREPGSRRLIAHTASITALAFSRDGKVLASGADDDTVRLWDVAHANEQATLQGHRGAVCAVSFAPDGRTLATAGMDRTLIFWDVKTGKPLAMRQAHDAAVECLAYSPDGRTLATGGADATIKLWDVRTFQEVTAWKAHAGPVLAMAFSPNGMLLASGGIANEGGSEVVLWRGDASRTGSATRTP